MLRDSIKTALASLRKAKWRSFLTMLGTVIGVVSVMTTLSLGEGLKQQVKQQINQFGGDLITVRPGRIVTRDAQGKITGVSLLPSFGASTLTEQDLNLVQQSPGVRVAVPFSLLTGLAQTDDKEFDRALIIGTTDGLPQILQQKIEFGGFFTDDEGAKNVAVIGKRIAEQLLGENVPLGRSFRIRGQNFVVRGVFEEFPANPLSPTTDFNASIFIPYSAAKTINGGAPPIYQILAKPTMLNHTNDTVATINATLLNAHAGQQDFTILKQDENLAVTNKIVNTLTQVVAAVAAISLVVGGVGIMNIMLVAVTERTREIGIRKAVGATNRQILNQFLTEAAVLGFVGGIIGIVLSLLTNFLIRIFTDLQPVVTPGIALLAAGIALLVGLVFGITPAIKAAHRDPIDALRHE